MTAKRRASQLSATPTSQAMSDAAAAFAADLSSPLLTASLSATALSPPTAVIPSSVPTSPTSPSSSAPTAVNTPTAPTAVVGEGQTRLMQELATLADRQTTQRSADGEGESPAASEQRTAAAKGQRKSKGKSKKSPTNADAAAHRSSFIDKSSARDIRSFLNNQPGGGRASATSAGGGVGDGGAGVGVVGAVGGSALMSSPVKSALWTAAAPQVDIPALLAQFGIDRPSAKRPQPPPTQEGERRAEVMEEKKDGGAMLVRDEAKGGEAASAPVEQPVVPCRPSRVRRAAGGQRAVAPPPQRVTRARRAAQEQIEAEEVAAISAAEAATTSSASQPPPDASLSSTSLPVDAVASLTAPPFSPIADASDEGQIQPLERATTVITTTLEADITPSLSPDPAPSLSSSTLSPSPTLPHGMRPRLSDELTRQMSLTSTSSSTSTASVEASRLPTSDLSRPSRPSPPPCQSLPPTFKAYQGQALSCLLSSTLRLSSYGATTAGNVRPLNQDAFSLSSYPSLRLLSSSLSPSSDTAHPQFAVLGLFDGHGTMGESASRMCADFMPDRAAVLLAHQQQRHHRQAMAGGMRGMPLAEAFGCLTATFDAAQRLLLAVARTEQATIANVLKKHKPELTVIASTTCTSINKQQPTAPLPATSPSSSLSPSPSPPSPPSPPTPLSPSPQPRDAVLLIDSALDPFALCPLIRTGRGPSPMIHLDADDADVVMTDDSGSARRSPRLQAMTPPTLVQPAAAEEVARKEGANGTRDEAKQEGSTPPLPAERKRKGKKRKGAVSKSRRRQSPTSDLPRLPSQHPPAPPLSPTLRPSIDSLAHDISPPKLTSSSLLQPIKRSPLKRTNPPRIDPVISRGPPPFNPSSAATAFHARPGTVAVDVDYGTTGLLVVVDGADLFIANCGDSRAVVYAWREDHSDPTRTPPADGRRLSPPALTSHASLTSQVSRSLSCPSSSLTSPSPSSSSLLFPSPRGSPSSPSSPSSPWHPLYSTSDHDPSLPSPLSLSERSHILTHGGSLHSLPNQTRLYPATLSLAEARARALTLNMSRALGHNMLSQHGVEHRPEVGHVRVGVGVGEGEEKGGEGVGGEGWVVMGSDGLWDMLGVEEVLALVEKEVRQQRLRRTPCGGADGGGGGGVCLQCVCCALLASAEARWSARGGGDNITVVVARMSSTA